MAQRSVEILIGRLITDKAFRSAFSSDAMGTLVEAGHELTLTEIAALTTTSPELWTLVAERIDSRLQKASLN